MPHGSPRFYSPGLNTSARESTAVQNSFTAICPSNAFSLDLLSCNQNKNLGSILIRRETILIRLETTLFDNKVIRIFA
jgi:hypothetical protein